MAEVASLTSSTNEYDYLVHYMHSCSLLTENGEDLEAFKFQFVIAISIPSISELMLASFDCEEPTKAEKELYDVP